jgi:hypothetical protein
MIFNPDEYIKLLTEKIDNINKFINEGYNKLNGTENLTFKNKGAEIIYFFKNRNEQIPEEYLIQLTPEDHKEVVDFEQEQITRFKKTLDGTYKAYGPTSEELATLLVSQEEVNSCLLSPEKHLELLESVNAKI